MKWLAFLLLLVSSNVQAQSLVNPKVDLKNLKTFRTYYFIELESRNAHQFQVWYHSKENQWESALIAAQASQDTSTITRDQYLVNHTVYAGWAKPYLNYTPVPESLKHLEEGMITAIRRNHSGLTISEIQVHYLGEFARVATTELIPQSRDAIRRDLRAGSVYKRNFAVDLKAGTLTDLRQGGGGSGRLDLYTNPKAISHQWANFVMPSSIEGSSLYSLQFMQSTQDESAKEFVIPKIYSEALKELEQKILESTLQMDEFLFVNTPLVSNLQGVFKSQGDSVFPVGITQYQEFDVMLYGRATDYSKQLSRRLKFLVPVKPGDFSVSQLEPVSGITFTVAGSFEKGIFNLFATDAAMNTVGLEKFLDEKYFKLVTGDESQLFVEGFLEFRQDENAVTRDELTLPGVGEYTRFDIYPGRLRQYGLTKIILADE